jgi:mono/diheme cytochrome c family protein
MKTLALVSASVVLSLVAASCKPSGGKVDFTTQIKPILAQHCVACHNDETFAGNLILQNRVTAFSTLNNSPVIIPGDAAKSELYLSLNKPENDHKAMPAAGHRIDPHDVERIKQWINEGADWPTGEAGVIKPAKVHKGET